ncbi:hypothetical protein CDD83_7768 [Cordyceps sp. RAO-2017]|nr:hypothetical protein CDD83_7768 [Cordyceps sp. RAO-2017]
MLVALSVSSQVDEPRNKKEEQRPSSQGHQCFFFLLQPSCLLAGDVNPNVARPGLTACVLPSLGTAPVRPGHPWKEAEFVVILARSVEGTVDDPAPTARHAALESPSLAFWGEAGRVNLASGPSWGNQAGPCHAQASRASVSIRHPLCLSRRLPVPGRGAQPGSAIQRAAIPRGRARAQQRPPPNTAGGILARTTADRDEAAGAGERQRGRRSPFRHRPKRVAVGR